MSEPLRSIQQQLAETLLPPLLMVGVALLALNANYLLFHTLAEFIAVLIAFMAMVVASISLGFTRNQFSLYIAIAMGWCGALDLLHTLSYQGMGLLPLGIGGSNTATQLWLIARFLQALALLTAPFNWRVGITPVRLHLVFGGLAILAAVLAVTDYLPAAYIDGVGLTPFKIYTEYVIVLMLALAGVRYFVNRQQIAPRMLLHLLLAIVTLVLAELAFTQYISVYAMANAVGHLLKVLAYWFLYLALIHHFLREPFEMLARTASTYDAIPDPVLVIGADGRIHQANAAAALWTGQPVERLVGQSSHYLFHDRQIRPEHCPVCQQLHAKRGSTLLLELELGQRRIECSLAEFQCGKPAFVQVVRDITARHRLEAEREQLLNDLGARVKELRCMHAIAELVEQPDINIPRLLQGVVTLLPTAYRYSDRLGVRLDTFWGVAGDESPRSLPKSHLSCPIWVEGKAGGQLSVWYLEEPQASFLPDECALLANTARHVSETLDRLLSTEKIRRLSYMYEMLSATNRALARCDTPEALLNALFEALTAHNAFPILYMATTSTGQPPLRFQRSIGIPDELMPELKSLLQDSSNPIYDSIMACVDGQVRYVDTRSLKPLKSEHWIAFLEQQGIQGRALMPLICGGQLLGVVGILSRELNFDQSQIKLLQDMASDIRYGLDMLVAEQRRKAAEHHATLSDHRFHEVFKASPVPMQIVSLDNLGIVLVNPAFEQWLGYNMASVTNMEDLFGRIFEDPLERHSLWLNWWRDIAVAQRGEPISSPELRLRCQDGHYRIAQCSLTLVRHDLIMAWTDLTAIRQSEQSLRESERRFRHMIEQSISGIFVCRDDRFIYVNPHFCKMVGWSAIELCEQPMHQFIDTNRECWPRNSGLEQGCCVVPLQCKDGRWIELDLRASRIPWDDDLPATIVLVQDVTARKLAESQIAHYIQQLECAMKGTLQAVSNMVEMRDPYTAGHERRVGLIAKAIGQELGWSAERCDTLEMAGLVHDIGKIAIPAEILSKPSRLNALEMELVRGHAQAGYDILKDIPFAVPIADIIHQHHERLDGSGYPQHLSGAQILPEARVLGVADVIESMAAHRPYRPALGIMAALEEIERGKDSLYDAAVVEAAQRLIREKGYHLPV